MRKITASVLSCLVAALLLSGCITARHQQAFYVSPFNGNSGDYHSLPLRTDTARTAFYARVAGFGGWANDLQTDQFSGGDISLYAAQHQGMWQWYYGLDATFGSYVLGNWHARYAPNILPVNYDIPFPPPATAKELNALSGPRSFGGAGFSGGFNGVIRMGQGEWRFLGVETALHQEFGDYLHFRRQLPDSLATYIVRGSFLATVGLTTEWIFRTRQGDLGLRLAGGGYLGSAYHPAGVYDSVSQQYLHYGYLNFAFHYTFGQYTGYAMGETGTKSGSLRLGLIYRLNRPRLPPKQPSRSGF
jgi:hypothetical protein